MTQTFPPLCRFLLCAQFLSTYVRSLGRGGWEATNLCNISYIMSLRHKNCIKNTWPSKHKPVMPVNDVSETDLLGVICRFCSREISILEMSYGNPQLKMKEKCLSGSKLGRKQSAMSYRTVAFYGSHFNLLHQEIRTFPG